MANIKEAFHSFRLVFSRSAPVGKVMYFIGTRLFYPVFQTNSWTWFSLFILVMGAASYFRFWAAPLSAGVDVPQFWGFARAFQLYGLDFYRYADARAAIFPVEGWGYVYPPVWLLILRLCLLAAPNSSALEKMVTADWRWAEKTPIIAADLGIGLLLYLAIPGSKLKKLAFASLWLLHPTSWYNSAVFGQFDAIAALLLLAAVILMEKKHDRWGFAVAALAVLTKQHVFIPVAMIMMVCIHRLGWRRLAQDFGIFAGVVAAFSIPFLVTGNVIPYARSVFLPGMTPDYQTPLMYAFNGSSALITYFHLYFGWNTVHWFIYYIPALLAAIAAALFLTYRRNISYAQAALVGFLIFICFNYRINYQYLIIYIPLALWVAATTRWRSERIFSIIMAVLPAAWIWLFNDAFWFYYATPSHMEVVPMLERIGLYSTNRPDWAYVTLAMVLMGTFLTYIILAFVKWRRRRDDFSQLLIEAAEGDRQLAGVAEGK
jgi:hypothetical protein